jgi:hypothetical protein
VYTVQVSMKLFPMSRNADDVRVMQKLGVFALFDPDCFLESVRTVVSC